MKVVPPDSGAEKEHSPLVVPEVAPQRYGDLFHKADWAVKSHPWDEFENGLQFEHWDSSGIQWKASLHSTPGLATFRLIRSEQEESSSSERLEVRFLSSDFLQGHDYELNVRYAPESWDVEDYDVIVLRAFDSVGGQLHPNENGVKILTEGLFALRQKVEEAAAK